MPHSKVVIYNMDEPKRFESYIAANTNWIPPTNWNVKLFGAHMQSVKKGWEVPEESHNAFELIYVVQGNQFTMMEGISYFLKQGDILIVPPGFKHVNKCIDEDGLIYFIAHFNVDDTRFRQKMCRSVTFQYKQGTKENEGLKHGFKDWIDLIQQGVEYTTSHLFMIQSGLFRILSILAESESSHDEKNVSPRINHYATLIAESIKTHFRSHQIEGETLDSTEIRIEDIASSLSISAGYANEVFKEVYGISPRKYLSNLKLHEAKQLIHQPNLDLTMISNMLGYSSLAHFSRQYKRWTGMSPREYRKSVVSLMITDK